MAQTETGEQTTPPSWNTRALSHPLTPAALVLFSDVCFICMDQSAQKLVWRGIPAGQVLMIRMIMVTMGICLYRMHRDPEVLMTIFQWESRMLWLRGFVATLSIAAFYPSLVYISLSEAITTFHLRPFPIGFLCWLFLKETFSRIQLTACVFSFAAVLLIVQPEFLFGNTGEGHLEGVTYAQRLLGFGLCGMSMLASVADVLLLRIIGQADNGTLLLLYAITGIIVGLLLQLGHVRGAWFEMAVIGLSFTLALQYAEGAKVAVLGYFQILFSVIAQVCATGTSPSLEAYVGMAIIIASGVWSATSNSETPPKPISESQAEEEVELMAHDVEADAALSGPLSPTNPINKAGLP